MIAWLIVALVVSVPGVVLFVLERSREIDAQIAHALDVAPVDVSSLDGRGPVSGEPSTDAWWQR